MFPFNRKLTAALVLLFMAAPPAWSSFAQESGAAPAAAPGSAPAAASGTAPAATPGTAPAAAGTAPAAAPEPATLTEPPPEPTKPSRAEVMARVNGTIITQLELYRAVTVYLARNHMQRPVPAKEREQIQGKVLDDLIRGELLYQEAAKLQVAGLDEMVTAALAQDRARFSNETDFEQSLQQADITLKELQEITRRNIVCNNFIQKRFADATTVSEAEARKVYAENLDKVYRVPEKVRVSEILIAVDEKATPEDRTKARQTAEALLKRIKAGENFAEIAKVDSYDQSAARGGDVGEITRGETVPQFEKAAFALKPGEVSGVVATQFGFHIIKVTERHPAETEPFDKVKAQIMADLKKDKVYKEMLEYLGNLEKTAKIQKL